MRAFAAAFAFSLMLGTNAIASAQTERQQQQTKKAPRAEKEKKICRSSGRTGSRLSGNTVCKTLAEWQAQDSSDPTVRLPGAAPGL
jgi:hypothetical protein